MKNQWIRWLPFLVVAVELVLYLGGVLSLAEAAILLLILEGLLAVVVVGEFALLTRAYRRGRRSGAGRTEALDQALEAALPRPVAYLVRHEVRIFGAAAGALLRRRAVPAGEEAIPYAGRLKPFLIAMIVVSVVEVAVVELVVPWVWLRWALVILGAYGLLWVGAFAAAMVTRPHGLRDGVLRLRFAIFTDVAIPLPPVTMVGQSMSSHDGTVEVADGTLAVSVMGLTNVTLAFDSPAEVDLGKAGAHAVHQVRFYADQPEAVVRLLRAGQLSRQPGPVGSP